MKYHISIDFDYLSTGTMTLPHVTLPQRLLITQRPYVCIEAIPDFLSILPELRDNHRLVMPLSKLRTT